MPSLHSAAIAVHCAVARLTWVGGLVMMMLFWVAAYYTALLLVRCLPDVSVRRLFPSAVFVLLSESVVCTVTLTESCRCAWLPAFPCEHQSMLLHTNAGRAAPVASNDALLQVSGPGAQHLG
jgi:hypothetical protein